MNPESETVYARYRTVCPAGDWHTEVSCKVGFEAARWLAEQARDQHWLDAHMSGVARLALGAP